LEESGVHVSMLYPSQYSLPLVFNRYVALLALKRLPAKTRITFDADTYVIRNQEHYVAYRTWMKVLPVIEIFYPGDEVELIDWLEKFGYTFESESFQPWLSL
jgi:hypothetical protein